MDFKQGLYFGKLTAYVTDEDTVNLMGYLRREDNLGDIAGNATARVMVAGSGPTRTASSCSGGTMPAISSTS